jgi:phospholipase D-like protein
MFPADSTFATFLANAFAVFAFVLWLWLFITAARDLFSRKDMSSFAKFLWVILLLALPYVGIFAYILTQGDGMAERNNAQAKQARDELRNLVGFSAADEIAKLDRLRSQNVISDGEYLTLRSRLVT